MVSAMKIDDIIDTIERAEYTALTGGEISPSL